MGLRLRLILILTIPAVLVVGVYGLLRIRVERAELMEEDLGNMALTAKAIQIAVENALRDRQVSDVTRLLAEMAEKQEAIDRIRLFDRSLSPTLVSNVLSTGADVPAETLRRVMETGTPEAFYEPRGKQSLLFYITPLRDETGTVEGAMEILHLTSGIDRKVDAATRDVWIRLSVMVVAIVVLTGLVLQRQVLRPLARLMEGIRGVGLGQTGPPVPVERRDELGRVAEAFNEMTERLEAAQHRVCAETERSLELEQQIRQTETLAVAGKLASGLAHEVGTPLGIVSGRAEFLLKTLPLDEVGRKDLEIIIGQIDRISGIIRSLLDAVRPQNPEIRPTAVAEVLDRLLLLLRHAARRRGVTLTTSIAADLPPMLADPNQMQQVVINLVLNALEATPSGGRVVVSAARRGLDGRAGLVVSVGDTGPGIAPELIARLFKPFFTTKPPGQGTGLGLAICRDIIQAHQGDIRVESQVGVGTTFTMWVPQAEEHLT